MQSLIEDAWKDFAQTTMPHFPPNSPAYKHMRKVFFAGAVVIFCAVKRCGEPHVSVRAAQKFLDNLEKEFSRFRAQLDVNQVDPENN